jgi:hypothetical protein
MLTTNPPFWIDGILAANQVRFEICEALATGTDTSSCAELEILPPSRWGSRS